MLLKQGLQFLPCTFIFILNSLTGGLASFPNHTSLVFKMPGSQHEVKAAEVNILYMAETI